MTKLKTQKLTKPQKKNQEKMQKLLKEDGGLSLFQKEIKDISTLFANKENPFLVLETFISRVSFFQDQHNRSLDQLKSFYKIDEKVFLHLGPLHNHVRKCGRDYYKTDVQVKASEVQNHTACFRKRFSFKKQQDAVTDKRIFVLVDDYYTTPLRLSFIKIQERHPTNALNNAAVLAAQKKVSLFIKEHTSKIVESIIALQKLFP